MLTVCGLAACGGEYAGVTEDQAVERVHPIFRQRVETRDGDAFQYEVLESELPGQGTDARLVIWWRQIREDPTFQERGATLLCVYVWRREGRLETLARRRC